MPINRQDGLFFIGEQQGGRRKMKRYENQKMANIMALNYSDEYTQRRNTLQKIAERFDNEGIQYAFSCSFALFCDGIVDNFHDFDVLVAPNSFDKLVEVLDEIGFKKNYDKDPSREGHFCSMNFAEYTVDGIDIDVICEFGFNLFGSKFIYHFNSAETHRTTFGKLSVPIVEPEAQMVFYDMMTPWQPQRAFKRDLIKEYLLATGIRHSEILERTFAMKNIPYQIRANIASLIR